MDGMFMRVTEGKNSCEDCFENQISPVLNTVNALKLF